MSEEGCRGDADLSSQQLILEIRGYAMKQTIVPSPPKKARQIEQK